MDKSPALGELLTASDRAQTALVRSHGIRLRSTRPPQQPTAPPALFAEYGRQLAARTRSTHDQDPVRCALYLANIGLAVGALPAKPMAWPGSSGALSRDSSVGC